MSAPATHDVQLIDELRAALNELLGAERRLRSRDRRGPHGLTLSEVRALMALARGDDEAVTAGALAREADLNPATVTALLDSLEERGIATRRRAEDDRRRVVVSLTEHGRAVLDEATARWQARLDEALADVSADELRAAARVLRRLARLFDSG